MNDDFNAIHFLFFLILGCSLVTCQETTKVYRNPLLGKWVSPYGDDYYWDFLSDENVNYVRAGKECPGNEEITHFNARDEAKSTVYGPLKYRYHRSEDTIKFETYGSLNNRIWMKYAAMRENDILYLWNYKTLPGIENHIDEVSYYCLDGKIVLLQ